jgi:hypothetical protein
LPKVKIAKVTLLPQHFKASDIPKLRGYLARMMPQYQEIHNHTSDGKFRFVYPEMQFKYIDKIPVIIGYGRGIEILVKVFTEIGYLELNHCRIELPEKSIEIYEAELGECDKKQSYTFLTPWMALNQKNYEIIKHLTQSERDNKINRILWGNIRALAHGFDYWIPEPDKIHVKGNFNMNKTTFKGNTMVTFTGDFKTNFQIPKFLGLGKQVARGYGAVVKDGNVKHLHSI